MFDGCLNVLINKENYISLGELDEFRSNACERTLTYFFKFSAIHIEYVWVRLIISSDNHEDNLIHVDCKVLVCPRLTNGLHECEESTKTGY